MYEDKTRCYECGEEGHLSYECPKNTLGFRKPPPKKKKKKIAMKVNVKCFMFNYVYVLNLKNITQF